MPHAKAGDRLIIANCSGFYGDRFSAAKEMIQGGDIHVLTGDYLAELTMAILFKGRQKDPAAGYAVTFLKQMEQCMGLCLEKGIRVVTNAGGLNPEALAAALKEIAGKLNLNLKIAWIRGDDLMPRLGPLMEQGESFTHLDKGIPLKTSGLKPITANAYFGSWGIVEALNQGADIVIGGRIADAALVTGPAAWHYGWKRDEWDKLAGAMVAGHIIECGAQATGGNYSFLDEVPSFNKVGFPLAIIEPDGASVITKHPGTGGAVSVGTVTAQLLYEIEAPNYLTPDVIARFDTICLTETGKDQVRVSGIKGLPPTATTKVCINTLGGFQNTMTVVLTGLDIDKKAAIVENALFSALGGKDRFEKTHVQLIRSDKENPASNEEAFALLRISVMDADANKVGRLFSSKVVELALANIPGFTLTAPPSNGDPAILHWPTLVSTKHTEQIVSCDGVETVVQATAGETKPLAAQTTPPSAPGKPVTGDTVPAPLGRIFATRSGDKGGNANLGIWAKTPEAYAFLESFLTIDKFKALFTDVAPYEIKRYELPNLKALNFYIRGFLGEGVAASFKMDPQAKTFGEYVRARIIEAPASILPAP